MMRVLKIGVGSQIGAGLSGYVAELGAAFLCAELEITNTPRPDHAQYIASWLTVLKGDPKAIFTAASLATRAVDYLCGLQPDPDPDASHGQAIDDEQAFSGAATRPGESDRAASAKLGGLDQ